LARDRDPHQSIERDAGAADGFALLVVLGFLMLVSSLLIMFTTSTRVKLLTSNTRYNEARLGYAAEAINAVIARKIAADVAAAHGDGAGVSGVFVRCSIGRTELYTRVQPHSGLIDLNTASQDLLQVGFAALKFDAADASSLAGAVTQYRLAGSGSDPTDQPAVPVEAGLKHGPFEDVSELNDFAAMRRVSFGDLADVFTVYGKRSTLDMRAAPAAITNVVAGMSPDSSQHISQSGAASDVFTIETTIRFGGFSRYQGDIYGIGFADSPFAKRLSILPSDGIVRPNAAVAGANCNALLDPQTVGLFRAVFQ
jgi:general secretion pathway protein K